MATGGRVTGATATFVRRYLLLKLLILLFLEVKLIG